MSFSGRLTILILSNVSWPLGTELTSRDWSRRKRASQADAEKRVSDVVTEAKAAADRARRGAACSLSLTVAQLNL